MVSLRYSWFLTLTLSLLVGIGCDESASDSQVKNSPGHDHDHDHGPESLKDAISELTTLRNTIRDAFARNDPDTAHGPLHEVGHILEAIPELAGKEKVSAENQTVVKAAVDALMNAFANVDKTMHGQEGSTYAEESATIDTNLTTLSAACGIAVAPEDKKAAGEESSAETPAPDASATEAPAAETPAAETPIEGPAPAAETPNTGEKATP